MMCKKDALTAIAIVIFFIALGLAGSEDMAQSERETDYNGNYKKCLNKEEW